MPLAFIFALLVIIIIYYRHRRDKILCKMVDAT